MRTDIFIMIILMAAVTYIPRAIPAVLLEHIHVGRKAEKFLSFIPYTAMAALVVPGVLTVDSERFYVGIIGGMAALLLSYKGLKTTYVIIGSIAAVIITYLLVGIL